MQFISKKMINITRNKFKTANYFGSTYPEAPEHFLRFSIRPSSALSRNPEPVSGKTHFLSTGFADIGIILQGSATSCLRKYRMRLIKYHCIFIIIHVTDYLFFN